MVGVRIGVVALQGDFGAHRSALERAGAEVCEVRVPEHLDGLGGVVLPGGESTALLLLMRSRRLDEALIRFHARGGSILGTCAGLILLARRVERPSQASLGLLDAVVERNAYGRQVDSFVDNGLLELNPGGPVESEMVFIRAPRIREVGPGVRVAGRLRGEPVLLEEGRILAAAFHPEMSDRNDVHPHFVDMVRSGGRSASCAMGSERRSGQSCGR